MVLKRHDRRWSGAALGSSTTIATGRPPSLPGGAGLEALLEAALRRLEDYDHFRPCSGHR
jgi:hypothetical protein